MEIYRHQLIPTSLASSENFHKLLFGMDDYYLNLITDYCSAAYFTVEEIFINDEERGGGSNGGGGWCIIA